jgi:hypothetical protein
MEEEKEELAIADELTSLQTIQELTQLMRNGIGERVLQEG